MKVTKKISSSLLALFLIFQSMSTPIYALASNSTIKVNEEIEVVVDELDDDIPVYEDETDSSDIVSTLKNGDTIILLEESTDDFLYIEYDDQETLEEVQGYVLLEDIAFLFEKEENDDDSNNTNLDKEQSSEKPEEEQVNEEDLVEEEPDENESEEGSDLDDEAEDTNDEESNADGEAEDTNDEKTTSVEEDNSDDSDGELNEDVESELEEEENIETDDESSSPSQSTFNVTGEKLEGIALKDKTHVYSETSTNSKSKKSYPAGTILKYYDYSNNWYKTGVFINGVKEIGYIHKSHVETAMEKPVLLDGIAIKNKTPVYTKASKNSSIRKSYSEGSVLKFYTFSENWYKTGVFINGKKVTGYIHKNDVELPTDNPVLLEGIASKNKTPVYTKASTSSKKRKTYTQGSILKFYTFSDNWYKTGVFINGEKVTGYIHKNDVELPTDNPVLLEGIASKNKTPVYTKASTSSKKRKTYTQGSMLKFYTFSENWYKTGVFINGKKVTGYIHKNDVELPTDNPVLLEGVALKNRTPVYTKTSTSSKKHKTYAQGSILKFYTFSENWYKTGVFIDGEKVTGYIHKNDVDPATDNPVYKKGIALKNPTTVYSRASTNSKALKSYSTGRILIYYTYSKDWYRTGVYINGVKTTGYIHKSHVSETIESHYDISLDEAAKIQQKANAQTDKKVAYVHKDYVKNGRVNATALNVRSGPGSNYSTVGQLKNNDKVSVISTDGNWHQIKFNHNKQWVNASIDDISYYLDPNNFIDDPIQKFQFLDLSKPSGASLKSLNQYLSGKGILAGHGQSFINGGNTHNVNDAYLMSHALLETGNGESELAKGVKVGKDSNGKTTMLTSENKNKLTKVKTVYNMYGINANDNCAVKCGSERAYDEGWTTPEKAIVGGAKFIGEKYIHGNNITNTKQNTLYKMRWNPEYMDKTNSAGHQYATDIGWASKQVHRMANLYKELGNDFIVTDIPIYR